MIRTIKDYNYMLLNLLVFVVGTISYVHSEKLFIKIVGLNLVLFTLLFLTKLVVYKVYKIVDPIFDIIAFLVSIGWLILLRLNPYIAPKQLLWIFLGLMFFLIFIPIIKNVPTSLILKFKNTWLLITLLLLIVPLFIGIKVGGAKSWIDFFYLRVQPSELAKITFLIFLASWFRDHNGNNRKVYWISWLGTISSMGILVLQRDLGTALVFYLTFILILFLATGKKREPILGIIGLIIGGIIAYHYFPHVQVRVSTWLDPWQDPYNRGYQIILALFAFINGGITGMGLDNGYSYLIPEAHTDFIFAVIGEKLGILGSVGVILLYLFFLVFCYRKIRLIPTKGTRLLASGLVGITIIQAFIIMAGVTKLIPLTGLPLPFMSYGGSSTLSNFINLGIILGLSRGQSSILPANSKRFKQVLKTIGLVYFILILNVSYWQVIKNQTMLTNPLNPKFRGNTIVENIYIPNSLNKALERKEV